MNGSATAPTLRSYLFVAVQFVTLALIALTGPLVASYALALVAEIAGLTLGLWAVWAMRPGNFNVTPEPRAGARMVTHGPYRYIRHPMYSALLLTTLPLVLEAFTPLRAALWVTLLLDLVLKAGFEERLLAERLPGYAAYQRRTKRLLPLIY